MKKIFRCSFRFVIRGIHDDFATLCTSDQVFDIKLAETSNTLLLANPYRSSSMNKENNHILLTVKLLLIEEKRKKKNKYMTNNLGQFDSTFKT